MGKEVTIWTSDPNYEEYRHDLEEDMPNMTEEDRVAIFRQANLDSLQFQKDEMSIKLGMPILVVAELGLWDGTQMAYKEIESGNLADCFEPGSDSLQIRWFVDENGDLRCDDIHHDGVNHYLYRVLKPGIPEKAVDMLKEDISAGVASMAEIECCTARLGDAISTVYGIDVSEPGKKPERSEER